MKVKVNICNNKIYVKVQYKNSMITWIPTIMITNVVWSMHYRPARCHPDRIERAHTEFLAGKRMRSIILKSLAAHHQWELFEQFKKCMDIQSPQVGN